MPTNIGSPILGVDFIQ